MENKAENILKQIYKDFKEIGTYQFPETYQMLTEYFEGKDSIPVELPVKPANGGYYYLRNLKDNKDYDLETYAAKFTKLCYPDIECVCKAIDTQDYYLLDECGNYDYINTEEWSIILTDPEEYRRKVLNNEFVKFKKL